jgi:hypothetical protein
MKKIRRTRIRVRTGRLIVLQGEKTQENDPPVTEEQKCPLCGQPVNPHQMLNLLFSCTDEHALTNEKG